MESNSPFMLQTTNQRIILMSYSYDSYDSYMIVIIWIFSYEHNQIMMIMLYNHI